MDVVFQVGRTITLTGPDEPYNGCSHGNYRLISLHSKVLVRSAIFITISIKIVLGGAARKFRSGSNSNRERLLCGSNTFTGGGDIESFVPLFTTTKTLQACIRSDTRSLVYCIQLLCVSSADHGGAPSLS